MGLKEIAFGGVGIVVAALLSQEVEARAPQIADLLRRLALTSYTGAIRDRLNEEWAAHLDETPGVISKILAGLGFCIAAAGMRASSVNRSAHIRVFVFMAHVTAAQLGIMTAWFQKREKRGDHPLNLSERLYDRYLEASARVVTYLMRAVMNTPTIKALGDQSSRTPPSQ